MSDARYFIIFCSKLWTDLLNRIENDKAEVMPLKEQIVVQWTLS